MTQKKSKGTVANCFLFVVLKFSSNKILKWSWIPLRYHHQFNFLDPSVSCLNWHPCLAKKMFFGYESFGLSFYKGLPSFILLNVLYHNGTNNVGMIWVGSLMWGPIEIQSKDTTYLFLAKRPNIYFSLFSKFLFAIIKINV